MVETHTDGVEKVPNMQRQVKLMHVVANDEPVQVDSATATYTNEPGQEVGLVLEHVHAAITIVPVQEVVPVVPPAIVWRPAEEVLPVDVTAEPEVAAETTNSQSVSRVYIRKQRALALADGPAPQQSTSSSPTEVFISNISKPLQAVLTTPVTKRSRIQAGVVTEPPRQSRRQAKLPPEVINPAAASVCRQLGITNDRSDVVMDKYQEFWAKPLIRNHAKAMASMLGKEMPENTVIPEAVPVV